MKENDKIRGRDVAETRRQCFKIKTGLVEIVFFTNSMQKSKCDKR